MNKLLVGWRPYAIAVVVIGVLLAVYFVARSSSQADRFGDPAVLEQIKHANCGELRDWADAILRVDPDDKEAFDQAVGYSNAANDRMDELHCFDN